MRLSGLASGFDTDSMVENLMKVERMKMDRFTQQKQVNLWKQEEYNKMNNNIANFILNSKKNMGLNKVSSTGSITSSSYKRLDYVSRASSSNEDAIGAKVIGSSANGSFNVKTEQLAKSASFTTGEITDENLKGLTEMTLNLGNDISVTAKAKDGKNLTTKDITDAINNITKTVDGKEVKVDTGLSAFYDKNTKRIFIQKEATDQDIKNAEEGNPEKVEFNIGFKVTETKGELKEGTIEGIKNKFNSEADDAKSSSGQVAKATINGVEIYSKTNNIEFNGLNLELKQVTETEAIITVQTNTEGIIEKIQGLVKEYNELLDKVSSATGEKRYPSFHPLSQEEKGAMTDKDIELWEEKARSGMLNRDETLNRTMQNIRANMFKNVQGLDGKFKNITQIGISTEKYSQGAVGGRLEIDEDKLRAAIMDDADGVMELLFAEEKKDVDLTNDSSNNPIGSTNKGIFTGVYDGLIEGMQSIVERSGPGEDRDLLRSVRSNILIDFVTKRGSISDLDKSVSDIDKRIADLERALARKEDSYYQQFTQMEKYMYKMNNQSDWLGQQMMMQY